ncbi:MAG: hypothetical protein KDA89_04815 [Planctomycetaceae bacterium]|nr:hypothetical protein [Planctomycetaceae bacterium]
MVRPRSSDSVLQAGVEALSFRCAGRLLERPAEVEFCSRQINRIADEARAHDVSKPAGEVAAAVADNAGAVRVPEVPNRNVV